MRSKLFAIFNIVLSLVGLATITAAGTYYMATKGPRRLPNLPKVKAIAKVASPKFGPIVKMQYPDRSSCTAAVFDAQYAVTAAHCVREKMIGGLSGEKIKIFQDGGLDTQVTAVPAGFSDRLDLGIIKGDFTNFDQVEVVTNTNGLMQGGLFQTCGYPFGQKNYSCTPFSPVKLYMFHVQGLGALVPGMSGGPVFDSELRVVAVNSSVGDGYVEVVPLFGLYGAFDLE